MAEVSQQAVIWTAIAAIISCIVSSLALIFSIYFSTLQRQHNRNSVRPIAAVKLNRLDKTIKMSIQNVGTGPLTIKKLRFKHLSKEYYTLKWIVDEINQPAERVIERCTDGWTIAVGTELTMLSITPQNDAVANHIIKLLFNTSVELLYTDIYDKEFIEKPHQLDLCGKLDE